MGSKRIPIANYNFSGEIDGLGVKWRNACNFASVWCGGGVRQCRGEQSFHQKIIISTVSKVVLRSREGLENFEDFHGPNIEICEEGDEDDQKSVVEGGGGQLIPSEPKNPAIMFKFSEEDLNFGILAPMGPNGLDILKLCSKCCLLTYQVDEITLIPKLILSQNRNPEYLHSSRPQPLLASSWKTSWASTRISSFVPVTTRMSSSERSSRTNAWWSTRT